MKPTDRVLVKQAVELHLRHEPKKLSKSRIKRLRKMAHPQFRLRVGEFRIFYDIAEPNVHVLAVVKKSESISWLDEKGEAEQ